MQQFNRHLQTLNAAGDNHKLFTQAEVCVTSVTGIEPGVYDIEIWIVWSHMYVSMMGSDGLDHKHMV